MTSTGEAVMFWIVAPMMVIGALGLVLSKRAVYAALSMAFVMVLMGVVFLAQRADFLGLVQVFVYTGAVMMMFVFVVMVVGVDASDAPGGALRAHRWIAVLLALGLAVLIGVPLAAVTVPAAPAGNTAGGVSAIAMELFSKYLTAFEMIGVLLSIAGVAALVLAHRERLTPRVSQASLAARRVKDNVFVAGLPDGTPSELSVSQVLRARSQTENPAGFIEAVTESGQDITKGGQR